MLKRESNVLAILMEDCGTYNNPGKISKVILTMSANEEKFSKKNGRGDVLSTTAQKIILKIQ
jgi:hypothetical protein